MENRQCETANLMELGGHWHGKLIFGQDLKMENVPINYIEDCYTNTLLRKTKNGGKLIMISYSLLFYL